MLEDTHVALGQAVFPTLPELRIRHKYKSNLIYTPLVLSTIITKHNMLL